MRKKLKTKKGVSKRFKLTKKRKISYVPSGKSHLLTSKKKNRLRRMRRHGILKDKKQAQQLKRMLPYG